jgi:hypothetical protein
VNRQKYIQILHEEVGSIDWKQPLSTIKQQLEDAMNRASERCAKIIAQTAPIDTGELRASIMFFPAYVGDASHKLDAGTELDLGTGWESDQ